MPSWGEILVELQRSAQGRGGYPDFDGIRRKYLAQLYALTGRDTILYSTRWLDGSFPGTSITLEDMQGMMEVCRSLTGPTLDLILHSPGGSAEATASIAVPASEVHRRSRLCAPRRHVCGYHVGTGG